MKTLPVILFILCLSPCQAQDLSTVINSTYTFKPGKLTDKEQEEKLPALDKIWDLVESDTARYLPQLRAALQSSGRNFFFYFDGSSLLISLSPNTNDKNIAVEAIAKCDLDDISQVNFIRMMNNLAHEGINVTKAAIKILQDDNYAFILKEHALLFKQEYCLAYMLLPQQNTNYTDTLIDLFSQVSPTAQTSILTTLWFAYSCTGDEFLQATTTNKNISTTVKEHAKDLLENSRLLKEEATYVKAIGKVNMDSYRKLALQRFSDEALSELYLCTKVLRTEKNCR